MKIDFTKPLTNLNGEVFNDNGKPIPFSQLCITALEAAYPDERTMGGEDKFARYELVVKLNSSTGEVELSANEVASLKTVIGKLYGVGLVGAAYDTLDGTSRTEWAVDKIAAPGANEELPAPTTE